MAHAGFGGTASRVALILLLAACGKPDDATVSLREDTGAVPRTDAPPVPIDGNTPVEYPAALYEQAIGGTVLLKLFVDAQGVVVPESTRVEESSGYPALDSAALAAAPRLHYSPALRNGQPIASAFRQPIHFSPPARGGTPP